jgi:hypothetical protein
MQVYALFYDTVLAVEVILRIEVFWDVMLCRGWCTEDGLTFRQVRSHSPNHVVTSQEAVIVDSEVGLIGWSDRGPFQGTVLLGR